MEKKFFPKPPNIPPYYRHTPSPLPTPFLHNKLYNPNPHSSLLNHTPTSSVPIHITSPNPLSCFFQYHQNSIKSYTPIHITFSNIPSSYPERSRESTLCLILSNILDLFTSHRLILLSSHPEQSRESNSSDPFKCPGRILDLSWIYSGPILDLFWTLILLIFFIFPSRTIKGIKGQTSTSIISTLGIVKGGESVIEIDGTTTQPVLQHAGVTAWPGGWGPSRGWHVLGGWGWDGGQL